MRSINLIYWAALGVAVTANILSNVAFKRAMASFPSRWRWHSVLELILEPWMWMGLGMASILLATYLFAIREVPLSIAYPIVTGLAMAGIAVSASLFFGEALTAAKILGIAAIGVGILLLSH